MSSLRTAPHLAIGKTIGQNSGVSFSVGSSAEIKKTVKCTFMHAFTVLAAKMKRLETQFLHLRNGFPRFFIGAVVSAIGANVNQCDYMIAFGKWLSVADYFS
jgi:hypothetical protein